MSEFIVSAFLERHEITLEHVLEVSRRIERKTPRIAASRQRGRGYGTPSSGKPRPASPSLETGAASAASVLEARSQAARQYVTKGR